MGSLSEAANSFNQPKNIRGRKKVQEPPANQKTKKSKRNFFNSVPQDMALIPGSFTKLSPKRSKRKWAGKH